MIDINIDRKINVRDLVIARVEYYDGKTSPLDEGVDVSRDHAYDHPKDVEIGYALLKKCVNGDEVKYVNILSGDDTTPVYTEVEKHIRFCFSEPTPVIGGCENGTIEKAVYELELVSGEKKAGPCYILEEVPVGEFIDRKNKDIEEVSMRNIASALARTAAYFPDRIEFFQDCSRYFIPLGMLSLFNMKTGMDIQHKEKFDDYLNHGPQYTKK